MKFFKSFDRRQGYSLRAIGVLIILAISTLVPAFASAAELTERSIALSSSAAGSTDVTYTVNFTAVQAAGAFVVDFCSNSPVIGDTCTAPSGFDASGATSGDATVTGSTSKLVATDTITAGENVSVAISGINNPSASGPLYARIVSYDTTTDADAYTSTTPPNSGTGELDGGGVAMEINNSIGVSGTVMESMTFCVSGASITTDCGSTIAPTLKLGQTVGSTIALVPSAVSTGTIYTQISTNASSGAVISLKSDATGCGGLILAGSPTQCYITPATSGGITAGQPKFGVETGTVSTTGTDPSGTLEPATGSIYNNSNYLLHYVSGDASGVTSTYGDPFLDTAGAPDNNQNMPITFGASVSNSTPAGNYSADLSLIATSKF
jgi:hypothetical protein